MKDYKVNPVNRLEGEITLPGDKSISHRAIMIGSIAQGKTRVTNFSNNQDCLSTVGAFRDMGIKIDIDGNTAMIEGKGLYGLKAPEGALYLGNSGTTMRLILGILAGQPFKATLTGDKSLSARPMSRVTTPLKSMGAAIGGESSGEYAPLTIKGGKLKAISYVSPISRAQVKSSILFAGLYAKGTTCVKEKNKSRDHTERMLGSFGAKLTVKGNSVFIKPPHELKAQDIEVPGDISSASFYIVGATLLKSSSVIIKSVLCNPTRTGVLGVLARMGARITVAKKRDLGPEHDCDLKVASSRLGGVEISEDEIPSLIDELPILIVASSLADGRTVIKGARELRVKETDRINSITTNLKKMGADIEVIGDDIIVNGVSELKAASLESFGDHRTAMSMIMAALSAKGDSTISDTDCIDISFPAFLDTLKKLTLS
jgi:3-phosphoshikimate 1-carboxyvinyltransferase